MINITGDLVSVKTTDSRHFGFTKKKEVGTDFISKFGDAVGNSIKDVNGMQVNADKLGMKMLLKPESVNVADVVLAGQKAQLALDLTKNIIQKTIQAYKSLTSIR